MANQSDINSIKLAIKHYAEAYGSLESLQTKHKSLLQQGDQKTGVIGEFYSLLYLIYEYRNANVEYANPSQKGWDLHILDNSQVNLRVQVKTVSEYSKSRRISPIHKGWHQLHLILLDRQFLPEGFWSVSNDIFINSESILKNSVMPRPGYENSGSRIFENKIDRLPKLLKVLKKAF